MKAETKKDITKVFANLRKFGYKVQVNNTPQRMSVGQKDWVDYTIYNKRYLVFVEVKLGKDRLSEGQKETAKYLSSIMAINKTVYYFCIKTLKEAKKIHDDLLGKKL